jgi:hypothetical protein
LEGNSKYAVNSLISRKRIMNNKIFISNLMLVKGGVNSGIRIKIEWNVNGMKNINYNINYNINIMNE